jgi:hypothetical protein
MAKNCHAINGEELSPYIDAEYAEYFCAVLRTEKTRTRKREHQQ